MSILIVVLMMVILSSCATSNRSPDSVIDVTDYGANSNASADSYGTDGFMIRKAAPKHAESQPIDFFYKHCMGSMNRVWYSKTSYECERP